MKELLNSAPAGYQNYSDLGLNNVHFTKFISYGDPLFHLSGDYRV